MSFIRKITPEDREKITVWIQKNPEVTVAEIQYRWGIRKSHAQTLREAAAVPPPPSRSLRELYRSLPREGGPKPIIFASLGKRREP